MLLKGLRKRRKSALIAVIVFLAFVYVNTDHLFRFKQSAKETTATYFASREQILFFPTKVVCVQSENPFFFRKNYQ